MVKGNTIVIGIGELKHIEWGHKSDIKGEIACYGIG